MAGGLCRLGSPGQRGGEELPPDSAFPPPPPPLVDPARSSTLAWGNKATPPLPQQKHQQLTPVHLDVELAPVHHLDAERHHLLPASHPLALAPSHRRPRARAPPRPSPCLQVHGQVCACKSTAKSGDQKPAAPPPKCYGRSLMKFFSEKNKIEGNFSIQFL
jgi:hypothetical protein